MKRFRKRSKKAGKYKSVLEQKIAKVLGRKATYETEYVQYLLPKKYKPDFVVNSKHGKFYIEVKGWFRYEDQQKMRAVKFSNPELDIRMFFPNNNKVQGSKMTNSQWCEKYSFPYSIDTIPKEWL